MRKEISVAVLSLAFGCEQPVTSNLVAATSRADISPRWGQIVMASTMVDDAHAEACASARRVTLTSLRGQLRVWTYLVKNPACGSEPDTIDTRSYTVTAVEDEEGTKLYSANSPLGALWLYDNRPIGTEIPWVVEIADNSSVLGPGLDPVKTLVSVDITDNNLRPSGDTVYHLRVAFDQPVPTEVFQSLAYSLVMDPKQSGPVDPANPMVYDISVVSDLLPEHVVTQLRAISHVTSVMLLD